MGIYLCGNATFYEPGTEEHSYYFLILEGIYIIFEIYFIVKTILLFKSRMVLMRRPSFVIFYFLIHLNLIRNIICFLGGVLICYPKLFYHIIARYLYQGKQMISFILIYHIINILEQLKIMYKWK